MEFFPDIEPIRYEGPIPCYNNVIPPGLLEMITETLIPETR
ncbi:MAG: hypothetical protein NTV01_19825 [Bacteroidia bacterium]|nr:hypothetical protein [Bacteroidia bacterium]